MQRRDRTLPVGVYPPRMGREANMAAQAEEPAYSDLHKPPSDRQEEGGIQPHNTLGRGHETHRLNLAGALAVWDRFCRRNSTRVLPARWHLRCAISSYAAQPVQ